MYIDGGPNSHTEEAWVHLSGEAALCFLFSYAAEYDYEMIQADIRTAFLNGPLEVVYSKQPPGFHDDTDHVWCLHKALYGPKQGARAWYIDLRDYLHTLGYILMQADVATFVKQASMYIPLYTC